MEGLAAAAVAAAAGVAAAALILVTYLPIVLPTRLRADPVFSCHWALKEATSQKRTLVDRGIKI